MITKAWTSDQGEEQRPPSKNATVICLVLGSILLLVLFVFSHVVSNRVTEPKGGGEAEPVTPKVSPAVKQEFASDKPVPLNSPTPPQSASDNSDSTNASTSKDSEEEAAPQNPASGSEPPNQD